METVIKIIGTVIVCVGLVYLIKPEIFRVIMGFFAKGNRLYIAAVIRFSLAIVFFPRRPTLRHKMGHRAVRFDLPAFGAVDFYAGTRKGQRCYQVVSGTAEFCL